MFQAYVPSIGVQDNTVYTAGDGVLEGTVRRLILDICAAEGIPVTLTPPKLADIGRWQGAFISSTSRLLLPVNEVWYCTSLSKPSNTAAVHTDGEHWDPLPPPDGVVRFGACELVEKLDNLVRQRVDENSCDFL